MNSVCSFADIYFNTRKVCFAGAIYVFFSRNTLLFQLAELSGPGIRHGFPDEGEKPSLVGFGQ